MKLHKYVTYLLTLTLTHLLKAPGPTRSSTFKNMYPYLAISFKMLANRHRFFDKAVQVFRNIRCQSLSFEDAKDLVAGDVADLSYTVRVTKNNTWTRPDSTTSHDTASRHWCHCHQYRRHGMVSGTGVIVINDQYRRHHGMVSSTAHHIVCNGNRCADAIITLPAAITTDTVEICVKMTTFVTTWSLKRINTAYICDLPNTSIMWQYICDHNSGKTRLMFIIFALL